MATHPSTTLPKIPQRQFTWLERLPKSNRKPGRKEDHGDSNPNPSLLPGFLFPPTLVIHAKSAYLSVGLAPDDGRPEMAAYGP